MSQANFTPISLYYSTTASAVPTAANLVPGELAINTNDGKLYYEDSSGVVQVLATKSTGSIGGSNTQVQFNNSGSLGGSSGLTWDGSFLTTSSIKNTALTSGRVTYAGASGLLTDSATLTYNGTTLTATTGANFCTTSGNVGIGTTSTVRKLSIDGVSSVSGDDRSLISVYDSTSYATGVGGGIAFGGNSESTASQRSTFGAIKGIKENSSINTYEGALVFSTSNFASTVSEKVRISSTGSVGIGTSSPTAKLEVVGVEAIRAVNDAAYISFYNSANTTRSGYLQILPSGASTLSVDGAQPLTFQTTNTERMRITSAGVVGIGTSSPDASYRLNLSGTNTVFPAVYFNNTTSSKDYSIRVSGTDFIIRDNTSGNDRVYIDTSGNLLLGTSSGLNSGSIVLVKSGTTSNGIVFKDTNSTGGNQLYFNNSSGTNVGTINTSATVTLYNTTSDQRLKENIVDAPSGNIDAIKVRSFDWIVDGSHQEYGMVAQELIEVAPYAVNKPENSDEMMAVDYSKLVPMMIKEIQDLKQRIKTLENK